MCDTGAVAAVFTFSKEDPVVTNGNSVVVVFLWIYGLNKRTPVEGA